MATQWARTIFEAVSAAVSDMELPWDEQMCANGGSSNDKKRSFSSLKLFFLQCKWSKTAMFGIVRLVKVWPPFP